jgi:hypothetical protein
MLQLVARQRSALQWSRWIGITWRGLIRIGKKTSKWSEVLERGPRRLVRITEEFLFCFNIGGWSPYWVYSALRPLMAYCTCPGWWWELRSWWNERFWHGKPKYSDRICPDATLSTTNPTCQTRARTRAPAVGSQRLTASAVARPLI